MQLINFQTAQMSAWSESHHLRNWQNLAEDAALNDTENISGLFVSFKQMLHNVRWVIETFDWHQAPQNKKLF